jgi:tetraacyldisaccharide 4'-kinase
LFDQKILPVFEPEIDTIGIGNLTVGGTGKTPVVNYLLNLFQDRSVGVISRGYGRKTKGFLEISENCTPETVGDEPFMLFKNNHKVNFFVSEKRVEGYKEAKQIYPNLDLFIFDDVFQHRYIKTKINILLCDFSRPFFDDYVLPTGLLRESRNGANRANLILVTKCPKDISEETKLFFRSKIKIYTNSEVFFANFENLQPANSYGEVINNSDEVVLISGLANNLNFKREQEQNLRIHKHFEFKDHHAYSMREINEILKEYPNTKLVTTEKDYVKMDAFLGDLQKKKIFVAKQKVNVFDEENFKLRIFDILNSTISK